MFTSSPTLTQQIDRMIGLTPVIDTHSRIQWNDQTNANLLGDPGLQSQLQAVGMPPGEHPRDSDPLDRLRQAIPHLRSIRNTAASWVFFRILRDLYDFHDAEINESNARDLIDRVASSRQDPDWQRTVLQERCGLRAVLAPETDAATRAPAFSFHRFDPADFLSHAEAETRATPERLERLVKDGLDRRSTGRFRCSSLTLNAARPIEKPDEHRIRAVLDRAAKGDSLQGPTRAALVPYLEWKTLEWHHDHGGTVQLIGEPNGPGGWEWLTPLVQRFSRARFDLISAPGSFEHAAVALAQRVVNVHVAGCGSALLAPGQTSALIAARFETVPVTKFSLFASGAGTAAWTYGRWQFVRKALAVTLARSVEERQIEEEALPALLDQVLHQTPRDLYEIRE